MAKAKSGALNLPLMIVAFLAMGGFLYWLSVTSEPTEFAVAEENRTADLPTATSVSPVEFSEGPAGYVGERIRIPNVAVRDLTGLNLIWFHLANEEETPYLVRIDRRFVADDLQVLRDDVISLAGTVHAMSDSVLTAWEDLGIFTAEGQRGLVQAQESFIEADQIDLHTTREPAEEPGDGDEADPGDEG
jgi:hypothetical protein